MESSRPAVEEATGVRLGAVLCCNGTGSAQAARDETFFNPKSSATRGCPSPTLDDALDQ